VEIRAFEKEDLEGEGSDKGGLEQLINQADEALYESKNSGRNRSTVYSKPQILNLK
jgi:GGDEF domain-containing protein